MKMTAHTVYTVELSPAEAECISVIINAISEAESLAASGLDYGHIISRAVAELPESLADQIDPLAKAFANPPPISE